MQRAAPPCPAPPRDRFIGWSVAQREARLHLVVGVDPLSWTHSRIVEPFLIGYEDTRDRTDVQQLVPSPLLRASRDTSSARMMPMRPSAAMAAAGSAASTNGSPVCR